MLHKAGEYAKQANITLVPEALNRFECYLVNTMADLKTLLDDVNHPNVRGMYDSHHANIEEKSQQKAILDIEPYLHHVHISENDRGTPGKGQINFDEVFKTLKTVGYDSWITVEGFCTIMPEFSNSINVWRNFSPIEEIYEGGLELIKTKWTNA
jgi:D-psicose/D-tagatose/L-ribulose 3-epimerase